MHSLSERIEDIILQHDNRGMRRLHLAMSPGYCYRAARIILNNRGTVLIGTGFPVSGSFESDGPIGAIARLPNWISNRYLSAPRRFLRFYPAIL